MASTASPVPSNLSFSDADQDFSDRLDDDIAKVRAEIQSLTKRKNQLVSSLLSSTKVQSQLNGGETNTETRPDELPTFQTPLQAHDQHNTSNIHRLAYGVTSFPFTDPNPDAVSDKPLLGVRFDILDNLTGRFSTAPYYIFLKRVKQQHGDKHDENTASNPSTTTAGDNERLQIHHHTIPALIPLQDYETKYLSPSISPHEQPDDSDPRSQRAPSKDEGYHSPSSERDNDEMQVQTSNASLVGSSATVTATARQMGSQDLHGLVTAVRRDLSSWHLRTDAIRHLSEKLQPESSQSSSSSTRDQQDLTGKKDVGGNSEKPHIYTHLQSVQATGVDARFCRLVWKNGTVARLRITDEGDIDRAVVIGDTGEGGGGAPDRLRDLERILCTSPDGGVLGIGDLPERLYLIETKMDEMAKRLSTETNEDGEQGDSIMADEDSQASEPEQ